MSAADELYRELIEPIEERMMRAVSRIVRDPDDAADAFQNALVYIWKDLKKIHSHPNPPSTSRRSTASACCLGSDAMAWRTACSASGYFGCTT